MCGSPMAMQISFVDSYRFMFVQPSKEKMPLTHLNFCAFVGPLKSSTSAEKKNCDNQIKRKILMINSVSPLLLGHCPCWGNGIRGIFDQK